MMAVAVNWPCGSGRPVPPRATGTPIPCASSDDAGRVTSVPSGTGQPWSGATATQG